MVAKDRAISELASIADGGYWNLEPKDKLRVREIGRLLSLPDDTKTTLRAMSSYVYGEEKMFFTP